MKSKCKYSMVISPDDDELSLNPICGYQQEEYPDGRIYQYSCGCINLIDVLVLDLPILYSANEIECVFDIDFQDMEPMNFHLPSIELLQQLYMRGIRPRGVNYWADNFYRFDFTSGNVLGPPVKHYSPRAHVMLIAFNR